MPRWLTSNETRFWDEKIQNSINWEQPLVSVYGKSYLIPRKTAFVGDQGVVYRYSGVENKAKGYQNSV